MPRMPHEVALEKRQEDNSFFFCIASMRPADAARTAQSYAENFFKHGHARTVPTVIFLDNKPEQMNEAEKAKYDTELEEMYKILKTCRNDVYVVMPEDKQAFTKFLKGAMYKERPDYAGAIDDGLLETMLGGSCGANKNTMLLYTVGNRIVNVDDDMRHYELSQKLDFGHYIQESPDNGFVRGHETSVTGEPVYDILKDFEPYRYQELAEWEEYLSNVFREQLFVNTYDVLGAYFSAMQPYDKLRALPVYQCITYNDSEPYTNTTDSSASFSSYRHLYSLLDRSKYSSLFPSRETERMPKSHGMGIFDGLKPYPVRLEGRYRIDKLPKYQVKRVRFVQGFKTGLPDYDAEDFRRYATHYPSLTNPDAMHCAFAASMHGRSYTPLLATEGYSIDGGILGIDNTGEGVGPFIRGLRIDDFAMRLESLKKDCLTAYLPFGQTHLRSPERSNIGNAVCSEEIGTLLKIKLLNGRREDDSGFDVDTTVNDETIFAMLNNARDKVTEIEERIEEVRHNGGAEEQIAMFERMKGELLREYRQFDPEEFGKYVHQSIEQEANLYLSLYELWPEMREIVKSHRLDLPITNGKTGEKTTVKAVRDKHNQRSHDFSMTYYDLGFANYDDDTVRVHMDLSATQDLNHIRFGRRGEIVALHTEQRHVNH